MLKCVSIQKTLDYILKIIDEMLRIGLNQFRGLTR